MEDYNIPYGYSPVLLTSNSNLKNDADKISRFLQATAKGYREAVRSPELAARVLSEFAEETEDFLLESLKRLSPCMLDQDGQFGVMQDKKWSQFIGFLHKSGMLKDEEYMSIKEDRLYTNELLPASPQD